jgi:hypothetical protein
MEVFQEMVGSIQASPKLRHFLLTSKVAILLLVMGCASPSVQQKPAVQQTRELGQSGARTTVYFQPKQEKLPSYPAWFWNMPGSEDSLYAVGLSETFAHAETSEQMAIADGVENLARALSVHIKGEYGMERRGGRLIPSGSDMQEEASSTMRDFAEKHHQVTAKHVSPMHTFVLLRLGEGGTAIPVSSTASTALPEEPGWVTSLPKGPGYIYASGQSNPYYRETESWRSAEEHARVALALNLESNLRGLIRRETIREGGRLHALGDSTIIVVNTDVQLNRVQIVARWKHPKYRTCHVLV